MKKMESRSMLLFENSIKSEYTKRAYIYGLENLLSATNSQTSIQF